VVKELWEARGKTFGPQPLRRNILVADSKEEAIVEYARVAQGRYITYAQRGLDVMAGTDLDNDFAKAVEGHAVLGTDDDVAQRLVDLVTTLPVDPLLVRPQWPTMDVEETIATINRLGKTVVPAVRAVTPRTTLPELSEGSAG
jgi:alkanesulfonate monooxygenase SsuD/methylene tetrahydromethanopterin reductase-like flavin-dependent oxidoreductase (luciferase family)